MLCMIKVIRVRQINYALTLLIAQHMSWSLRTRRQIFLLGKFSTANTVGYGDYMSNESWNIIGFRKNQYHLQVCHFSKLLQQLVKQLASLCIKTDKRIVHDEHTRVGHQGLGKLKLTQLPTRQQYDVLIEHCLYTEKIVKSVAQFWVLTFWQKISHYRGFIQVLRVPSLLIIIVSVGIAIRIAESDILYIIRHKVRVRWREIILHLIHQQRIAFCHRIDQQAFSGTVSANYRHVFSLSYLKVDRFFQSVKRMTRYPVFYRNYILHCYICL